MKSARAERKERIMAMSAKGPTLCPVPTRNPSTFLEAQSMNLNLKRKCQSEIDEMLRTRTIECFTPKNYFALLALLRERRCALSREHRLLECIEVDDLMAQLSDYFFENVLYTSKAQEISVIEAQLESVKNKLNDSEEKWQSEMDRKYRKKENDENKKQEQTVRNLKDYDGKIDEVLPPEFCKLTPSTLELHEREKHLICSRKFKEASQVHEEFEKAQKKDLVKRREQYVRQFENKREVVVNRNEKIISANQTDWERIISHAEHMKNKELKPLRNAVEFLETKLRTAKAEYIGEDDPIVRKDDVKPSLRPIPRDMPPKAHKVPTKQMANTLQKKNTKLDSTRWPPKPHH